MKVGVEVEAGAEAEVGKARHGLNFRPALLFGSGPARRRRAEEETKRKEKRKKEE